MATLDETDRRLLSLLAHDSRMSLRDLGEAVGLSSPSVSERLRRLQERRVVRAFTVDLEPKALGYSVQALVRIRPLPGRVALVQKLIEELPGIVECDRVTGEDCFIARLFVPTIEDLDQALGKLADEAQTSTSVVKSQPVRRRAPLFR
jgi:Lrp/AsnC family leucine-responsive transcriptional regulator